MEALIREGVVEPERLRALLNAVEAELFRYRAIDGRSLRVALDRLGH